MNPLGYSVSSKIIFFCFFLPAESFQEFAGLLQEVEHDRMMLVCYQLPPPASCSKDGFNSRKQLAATAKKADALFIVREVQGASRH